MRVLHIINSIDVGGAEKLIVDSLPLYNEKKDVEVELLVIDGKNNNTAFQRYLLDRNVNIHNLESGLLNPLNVFKLFKFFKNKKYDIIHSHLFPTFYWVSIVSWILRGGDSPKFVMTEHNTHNNRRNKPALRQLEKKIYSSYSKIICISKGVQINIKDWLKEDNEVRFPIIHNGINVDHFKSAKPYNNKEIEVSIPEDSILICMVGSFTEQKDQKTLIDSLNVLPENYHLILIGDGPLKNENYEYAKKLKISRRIHFLGVRNDVNRILKSSDIIVLSSKWEGFGLAAIEGMAAGKPVIVTNVEGLKDVIGKAGYVFEPGDYSELANLILSIEDQTYEKMANESLIQAESFVVERMIEEHLRLYKDILAK